MTLRITKTPGLKAKDAIVLPVLKTGTRRHLYQKYPGLETIVKRYDFKAVAGEVVVVMGAGKQGKTDAVGRLVLADLFIAAAGLFLSQFVGAVPFAYIDISGTAYLPKPSYFHTQSGTTGFGVRLLESFLRQLCKVVFLCRRLHRP